ncbi:MAG: NERD domain-containing protein [Proteobacteria bacterium]|nr:NERD domain-containing protein [Pseudomonadota bacterium]MCH7920543.1 NERD domain-containing protein [Planctomycetota bacterium]
MRLEKEIYDELAEVCASPGYLHAIAYLCFRDNMVRFSGEMTADDMKDMFSADRLIRTEISTLVGLSLKKERDLSLPAPDVIEKYINRSEELLEELHKLMSAQMFSELLLHGKETGDPAEDSLESVLREPIFYGGESAYSCQYRDLSIDKYSNDDSWLISNKGFSVRKAQQVVRAIGSIQDEKVFDVLKDMKNKNPIDRTILPGFILTGQEVAEKTDLDVKEITAVLSAFSVTADERNDDFQTINDFNVANAKPLIQIDDNTFILFQIYSLVESLYESPFYWMGSDESYCDYAMNNRGKFTETFSAKRLKSVFGDDNVHSNVNIYRKKSEIEGEIDVLVLFGNRAIVVQTKSKRLTLEARKGNVAQIKSDFQKSIQDSYDQALSCSRLLTKPGYTFQDGHSNKIDMPSNIKEIYILCVVSDHYPALSFQVRQFLKYETTSAIQPPFVMDVFLLDVMVEFLASPLRLLSYISQRSNYADRLIVSHELTILAYHLKMNLWLDDDVDLIHLHDDITAELDVAVAARRDGVPGNKTPDGILTRFAQTSIGRIVEQIESRQDLAIIDLGFLLLTISEDSVTDISTGIDKIASQARIDRKSHDLTLGFGKDETGLTIHCNYDPITVAGPRLQVHCHGRKYTQKAKTWFGLCISPDDALPKFGLNLDYDWEQSPEMDAETSHYTKRSNVDLSKSGSTKKKER